MLQILITVPPHLPACAKLCASSDLRITLIDEPSGGHGLDAIDWPAHALRGKDILFCSGVAPRNIDDLDRARWVQLASAGYEQWLPYDMPGRGVRVTNALGAFDVPIAEWNVTMMVALARDLPGMIRNQQRGTWDRDKRFQTEVRGSTVGFWGYGGLARETARLCKAMGMRVHVLVRSGVKARPYHYLVPGTGDREGRLPDHVFGLEQKAEFLSSLDFLVVAMPLTPATQGAIGEAELRALRPTAFVLNPARGPLIQEAALLRALREGWIAGAALDTHYHYPMPPEHPLWRMPNVIMTPHISGSGEMQHYLPRVWDIFAQNLDRFARDEPLLNEVTPAQLHGQ